METMDKYDKGGLVGFLVEADRVGNRLSGGKRHPKKWWTSEHTISARVGYFSDVVLSGKYRPLWKFWAALIDLAFFPVDGPYHCKQAVWKELDADPDYDFQDGSKLLQFVLMTILGVFCPLIGAVLWTAKRFK